jgi:beta-carotene ketolase (CrtW type)
MAFSILDVPTDARPMSSSRRTDISEADDVSDDSWTSLVGVAIAVTILASWGLHLVVLLGWGASLLPTWLWPLSIGLQTFLHTGLFITAHDAMHGTVCPRHEGLNDALGRIAVVLYALFSYESLRREHWAHHDHPVTASDPDAADEGRAGWLAWYLDFMGTYLGVGQLIGMAVVYNVLMHGIGLSAMALNLFWVLPSLLSTLQLFTFGTYLPHRREDGTFRDEHRARSNDYAPWLSFLTCYHFGYHWEHHARPHLPWWRLPAYRRRRLDNTTESVSRASYERPDAGR